MSLSLTKDYTFAPNTTISSSEVNTDMDELYNAFSGLEAMTSTLAALKMDADPTTALAVATKQYVDAYANYRRPVLSFISTTTVDVEVNTGTANTTKIIFPDGNYRSVTEDTSSANKYRRFDITADAEFTSGTEESGLRAALTEAVNTWYAIYAVKSLINTANFVLVGDTTLPTVGNVSTLNGYYGTNGWVYLGLIRNGDNSGSTGDILNFEMVGNMTSLKNVLQASVISLNEATHGIAWVATVTDTGSAYSYSAGTGATAIPNNISHVSWLIENGTSANANIRILDSAGSKLFSMVNANARVLQLTRWLNVADGIRINSSASQELTIIFSSWIDRALGVGSNPFI